MKYPCSNVFLNLWWLVPTYLQPRFIRVLYAKHFYKWLRWREWDIRRSYKYTKALVGDKDFLNIKRRDTKSNIVSFLSKEYQYGI